MKRRIQKGRCWKNGKSRDSSIQGFFCDAFEGVGELVLKNTLKAQCVVLIT